MGGIGNLRRTRKAKARANADAEASAKRVQFGRTQTEKRWTKAGKWAAERKLDGHKRNDDIDD